MRSETPVPASLANPLLLYSSVRSCSSTLPFPLNIPRRGSTRHTILFISEAISLSFNAPARDILMDLQRRGLRKLDVAGVVRHLMYRWSKGISAGV